MHTVSNGFTGMGSMIITAAFLGLSAGISPGPLLTLVITETLRYGRKEGMKVAFSPLLTDLPVILVSLLFLKGFGRSDTILGILSLAGGIFILYLSYECLKTRKLLPGLVNPAPASLRKGITANLLNPNPYFFWITVGAPLVYQAWQNSIWAVAAFFFTFYFFLVGSKITVAILAERSKSFLNNRGYVWVMRMMGVVLLVFALIFLKKGITIFPGLT
jgi:threonine/homoserine/homoserine lactone efflux protein